MLSSPDVMYQKRINDYFQSFCQLVILSEVELSPSEKRGESARLLAEAGSRNNS